MIQRNDKKRQPSRYRHAFKCSVTAVRVASVIAALSMHPGAHAQTQLTPPKPLVQNAALPTTANPTATSPTALKPPAPSAAPSAPAAALTPLAQSATALAANAGIIKFEPGKISLVQLRALPPDALIELNNGRKIKAAHFVATADALKGLSAKTVKLKRMDFTFTRPISVAQVKLNATNLALARSMAPNTVLELPNGLKMTTGELKQLDTLEARTNIRQMLIAQLGTGAAAPSKYAGRPAIKLRSKADIEQLKGKPDSTIVEAPDGSRATLGEMKAALAEKFGGARK